MCYMYLFERGKEPGEKPEVTESPQGNQGDNNMGEEDRSPWFAVGGEGHCHQVLAQMPVDFALCH